MLLQRCNAADHQIRTGLCRVFDLDVQSRFQARADDQAGLTRQLADGRLHGIENLRNNTCNDSAFNGCRISLINIQQDLQVDAVFVRCFGRFRADAAFKYDGIALHTADHDVGIAYINSKDHIISSNSCSDRILQQRICPLSVSIMATVPPP